MNGTALIVGLLVAGLIAWLLVLLRRRRARLAVAKWDAALKRLQELDVELRNTLEASARRGTTVSVDKVLEAEERLRQQYINSGQEEDARTVERSIKEFREKHSSEIRVDKAHALMTEIEAKYNSQTCKRCGKQSEPGQRFCASCGYPLVFIPSDPLPP